MKEDSKKNKEVEGTSDYWKKIMKEKEEQKRVAKSYGRANPIVYSTPSGSAHLSGPIVTSKASGWIGMFGDDYLCQLGCDRFVSKKLDSVINFVVKGIRKYYEPKEKVAKKSKGIEVKSYVRKPRKKKEEVEADNHEKHLETYIKTEEKLGIKGPTKEQANRFIDEVEKGKVLFVDDKSIKLKPKKTKVEKNEVAIADGVEVDDTGQWKKKGEYMYPVNKKKMDKAEGLTEDQLKRRKARYEEGRLDDVVDEKK